MDTIFIAVSLIVFFRDTARLQYGSNRERTWQRRATTLSSAIWRSDGSDFLRKSLQTPFVAMAQQQAAVAYICDSIIRRNAKWRGRNPAIQNNMR
jgi:hypothetical protein